MEITPESIKSLRVDDLGESLSEFGERMAKSIHPGRRPYSRQYVHRLESGEAKITPLIEMAICSMMAEVENLPPEISKAIGVKVVAQPGQLIDGVFIPKSAKTIDCANPDCPVKFVKTHPRQKYHDPECRKDRARRKR